MGMKLAFVAAALVLAGVVAVVVMRAKPLDPAPQTAVKAEENIPPAPAMVTPAAAPANAATTSPATTSATPVSLALGKDDLEAKWTRAVNLISANDPASAVVLLEQVKQTLQGSLAG